MHNALHLQHHRHTGKLLHHRHTSYHALFLLLAIAGAFIALTNHLATAASYDVTAIVPAPLPTTAAVITHPADGSVVTTPDIQVGGTCPVVTPAVIIVLYDNGALVGSTRCTAGGTFEMALSLGAGQHTLVVTVMNTTGQTGLTSDPIVITYKPPVGQAPVTTQPVQPSSGSGAGTTPTGADQSNVGTLQVVPAAPFLVFGVNTDTVWDGVFEGGTPPYTVYIDWGDGNFETHSGLPTGAQEFRHHYSASGSYLITIRIEDSAGHSVTRHYVALSPIASLVAGPITTTGTGSEGLRIALMPVLYSAYFTTVLCFFGFWWYERRHRRQWAHVRVTTHSHARQYHQQVATAKRRRR